MMIGGKTIRQNITGIDIKNIGNYITTDMILARKNVKINWSNLYEGALCKTVS